MLPLFSPNLSQRQQQAILDPRNRVSIPAQSSQITSARWNIVANKLSKTAKTDPVAVLEYKR